MKTKITARLLAAAVAVSLLSACSSGAGTGPSEASSASSQAASSSAAPASSAAPQAEDPNLNLTGYPIVNEKITLTAFGNQNVTHKDWSEVYCFQEIEKLTNIHIEWTTAPNQGFEEKKSVLLASGDYPDIFYRSHLSLADLVNYGSMGVFVELNDLIENYATNFNERAEEFPSLRKAITMANGSIYSLPYAMDPSLPNNNDFNWINKRWMDNLGLSAPNTLDELYTVLKAFKEQDANGNGDPNDEIPYSDRDSGETIWDSTYASFGMGNLGQGLGRDYIDVGEDGKIRLMATTDNFRRQLEWIARLYAEGLIDPEMFTQDIPSFTAKGEQDLIGAFFNNGQPEIIGSAVADDFIAIRTPEDEQGRHIHYRSKPVVQSVGAFAISNTNPYPEASVRWVDTFYGHDGDLILRLGKEGTTYTVNADGSYALTDFILNNPDGLNVPQSFGQYAIGPAGGACPEFAFRDIDIVRAYASTLNAYDAIKGDIPEGYTPASLTFTVEEQERLNALTNDIKTFITESKVQFVTGKQPLSGWDSYVSTIEKMGAAEYVEIYQAAYDRYLAS